MKTRYLSYDGITRKKFKIITGPKRFAPVQAEEAEFEDIACKVLASVIIFLGSFWLFYWGMVTMGAI